MYLYIQNKKRMRVYLVQLTWLPPLLTLQTLTWQIFWKLPKFQHEAPVCFTFMALSAAFHVRKHESSQKSIDHQWTNEASMGKDSPEYLTASPFLWLRRRHSWLHLRKTLHQQDQTEGFMNREKTSLELKCSVFFDQPKPVPYFCFIAKELLIL